MTMKDSARRILDELPDDELQAALRFLEYLRDRGSDPLLRTLANAPLDDEPETLEEAQAVQESLKAIERGETVPWEDVKRRLLEDDRQCPGASSLQNLPKGTSPSWPRGTGKEWLKRWTAWPTQDRET